MIDNAVVPLVTENTSTGGSGAFGKKRTVVGAFLLFLTLGARPPSPRPGQREQAFYWAHVHKTESGYFKMTDHESSKLLSIQPGYPHNRAFFSVDLWRRYDPKGEFGRLHN